MKGKLIKNIDYYPNDIMIYYSLIINEECIGTTHDLFNNEMTYKLSLKNCQTIERGYDLDELAGDEFENSGWTQGFREEMKEDFIEIYTGAFSKALEILGDRRFTEEDMMNCWNEALTFKIHKKTFCEFIQSLQQNEWEVEVEMDFIEEEQTGTSLVWGRFTPKLDADGCLILKRVV